MVITKWFVAGKLDFVVFCTELLLNNQIDVNPLRATLSVYTESALLLAAQMRDGLDCSICFGQSATGMPSIWAIAAANCWHTV